MHLAGRLGASPNPGPESKAFQAAELRIGRDREAASRVRPPTDPDIDPGWAGHLRRRATPSSRPDEPGTRRRSESFLPAIVPRRGRLTRTGGSRLGRSHEELRL